MTLIASNFP